MNLGELERTVLENVGDETAVTTPQLDRLINRAVEHVANIVELSSKFYNMAPTPISVTVSSGTEKYLLGATGVIRKILHVERTDLSGGDADVSIIDYRHKNRYRNTGVCVDSLSAAIGGA